MISILHCVPSAASQLDVDEAGFDSVTLQWTAEELDVNFVKVEEKVHGIDAVLQELDALESLSEVEFDEADVLWMEQKVYPEAQFFSNLTAQFPVDHVHDDVINNGAFTPPQTPPYEYQPQQQQQQQCQPEQVVPAPPICADLSDFMLEYAPTPAKNEVEEVVDELMRFANSFEEASPSPTSPSAASSSSSNGGASDSSSEDYDWTPQDDTKSTPKTSRKRTKPYDDMRTDDKRSRKKEQNKNAATRYRLKKKAEVAEIQSEESQLEQRKVELTSNVEDLEREIKCLKGLMRDFFKEKGLVR